MYRLEGEHSILRSELDSAMSCCVGDSVSTVLFCRLLVNCMCVVFMAVSLLSFCMSSLGNFLWLIDGKLCDMQHW